MKKRALLVVLLAIVLATAGVAYAAWQDSLTVYGNVSLGSINVLWVDGSAGDDEAYADCGIRFDSGNKRAIVEVANSYPGHVCTTHSTLRNEGLVPAALDGISLQVKRNSTILGSCATTAYPCLGVFEGGIAVFAAANTPEISWNTTNGTSCGFVALPGVGKETINQIRVKSAAPAGTVYEATQVLDFVDWKSAKYPEGTDASVCSTFNMAP